MTSSHSKREYAEVVAPTRRPLLPLDVDGYVIDNTVDNTRALLSGVGVRVLAKDEDGYVLDDTLPPSVIVYAQYAPTATAGGNKTSGEYAVPIAEYEERVSIARAPVRGAAAAVGSTATTATTTATTANTATTRKVKAATGNGAGQARAPALVCARGAATGGRACRNPADGGGLYCTWHTCQHGDGCVATKSSSEKVCTVHKDADGGAGSTTGKRARGVQRNAKKGSVYAGFGDAADETLV